MKSTEERLRSYEPLWENWRYTGELLGEGGMSSVFEICSDAFGAKEYSALKIITVKDSIGGKVSIPKNALNEINILRSLSDCANIVHYSDSTTREIYDDAGNVCGIDLLIRMEKLQVLSEGTRLSEKQIVKLATDMCRALVSASKKGIIHRDIKPQNIFTDGKDNFKLGDFGVAKIVSDTSMHYTKDIGTLAYAAPEICSETAESNYDASTDIYSLGLVLYAFLNDGYLPFVDPLTSLREAIMKRIRGSVFSSPKNGSKALKKIVMRACEYDNRRRYRTAQEMLDDVLLLSEDGKKKYIIDPFATVDANADIEEYEAAASFVADIPAPKEDAEVKPAKKPGLISSIRKTEPKSEVKAPPKADTPRFIGIPTPKSDAPKSAVTPVSSKPEVAASTPKGDPMVTTTGSSRFIGSLGGKSSSAATSAPEPKSTAPKTDAPAPKKEEPEKKSSSFFFKTPEL